MRLSFAHWLAERLPFLYTPRWINNALARWMWRVPGFDHPDQSMADLLTEIRDDGRC